MFQFKAHEDKIIRVIKTYIKIVFKKRFLQAQKMKHIILKNSINSNRNHLMDLQSLHHIQG
jgi:hypothetical protein